MLHRVDEKVLEDFPCGLSFWNIANAVSEWTQGGDVKETVIEETRDVLPMETKQEPKVQHTKKTSKRVYLQNTLVQFLMHVDPSFASYSKPLLSTLEDSMKEKLRDVITNGSIATLLGPKRCRLILSYLATMMMHECTPFFELWSFLLQAPIEANGVMIRWNVQEYSQNETVAIQYKK